MSGCQVLLLVAAAGLLGYCSFVLADSWIFQAQASRMLDRMHLQPASLTGPGIPARARLAPLPPEMDGLVGRMEIPRLGMSVVVSEGTRGRTLRRAAGHIEGTALPGHLGNVGISGHRDTLFRPLRNVLPDDVIVLTTLQGEYRYRVVSTQIVSPSDVAVLNPDGHEVLTLVTCYPFYFVGPAPDRFIVRAERLAEGI